MPAKLAGLPQDPADKPRRYTGENLWEFLNGGAHEIIRLGFKQLAVAYYRQPGAEWELRIQAFTMKSPDAAEALFNAWRSKNSGTGGICGRSVSDATALSWQRDAMYVQLITTLDGPRAKPLLERAGRELCAALTAK